MTEDEAKTKWCPFARMVAGRVAHNGDFSFNLTPPVFNRMESAGDPSSIVTPAATACIASACMAWRGRETAGFAAKAEREFRSTGVRLKPAGQDIDGYCGLAGNPRQ